MKKSTFFFTAIAVSLIFFVACKTKTDTAADDKKELKEIVLNYWHYTEAHKYDSLRLISTPKSEASIKLVESAYLEVKKGNPNIDKDIAMTESMVDHLTIGVPFINGDEATVICEEKMFSTKTTITLVKEMGTWKIDMSKTKNN